MGRKNYPLLTTKFAALRAVEVDKWIPQLDNKLECSLLNNEMFL